MKYVLTIVDTRIHSSGYDAQVFLDLSIQNDRMFTFTFTSGSQIPCLQGHRSWLSSNVISRFTFEDESDDDKVVDMEGGGGRWWRTGM